MIFIKPVKNVLISFGELFWIFRKMKIRIQVTKNSEKLKKILIFKKWIIILKIKKKSKENIKTLFDWFYKKKKKL